MQIRPLIDRRGLLLAMASAGLIAATPGCGTLATIAYWVKGGDRVPAKFSGLKGKRVAVVCLDTHSLGGPGSEADAIAKAVTLTLEANVKDIKMVRQSEVADWIDNQSGDLTDYRDVGRGVKSDMIVGIDLLSFNLHEGQTLLKGRARVGVKVYDMSKGNGELAYESAVKEIAWPENGARHVTENEANFRAIFIHTLAQKVSRDFYSYELMEEFAGDAAHLSN
jgi:hypothetical protein